MVLPPVPGGGLLANFAPGPRTVARERRAYLAWGSRGEIIS